MRRKAAAETAKRIFCSGLLLCLKEIKVLKYLVQSTEQLITAMVILGVVYGYLKNICEEKGARLFYGASGIGLVLAFIMTWFKVYTSKIDTGIWNLRIYSVTLAAFVLFLILTALRGKLGRIPAAIALCVYAVMILVYFFPFYLEMPHAALLTETSIVSTTALLKLIGLFLGFVLTLIAGIAVSRGTAAVSEGAALLLLVGVWLVNTAQQVASAFGIMLAKRIIRTNHTLFVISKHASNYKLAFIVLILVLCAILAAVIFAKSFTFNEPYTNPAERRKIIAKWRKRRNWSITTAASFLLSILVITAVNAYANREIELSPIEDAAVEDGKVVVPFDKVNDGHLHRFGYTTENGITVRFIVIQKPNSSAYGIGLDACDICGETGYYEKEGQVVCNLCDVVMNINTIGFKGGCNPIVIDYEIKNGSILVPVEGLVEYESEFK